MSVWLTLVELSDYIKLSRPYLYKLAQQGQVPCVKVGRSWRFNRDEIDAWMRQPSNPTKNKAFPWSDCFEEFLKGLQRHFGKRLASVWIYGSWARKEASDESDVDFLVVLDPITDFTSDFRIISDTAYSATFGRNRPFAFSTTLTDQKTFLEETEPLLLNIRKEGHRAA